uniref:START domain-containing protein n=1 Tax=Arcella intermedia TaxID=1963864 RepID=A0A6B2LG69_9EUKA
MESFNKFRSACDTEEGWPLVFEDKKKNIAVYQQASKDSNINIVKMRAVLNVPASVLYDVLHDADYRKAWDENMDEGYCIQQIDSHNDVGYYSAKSPFFGVSGRDFCNQRSWWRKEDGSEYIIHNHSVIHKDCPEKKQYVRAWSHMTGYMIRPNTDGTCTMVYLTQTDLRGWIPAWAINQGASKFAPGIVDKLTRVGPQYNDWKQKNNADHKPWLVTAPYVWEQTTETTTEQ